jgi:hypothetical protein
MSAEHRFRFIEWFSNCKHEGLKKEAKDMLPIIGVEAVVSMIEAWGENI